MQHEQLLEKKRALASKRMQIEKVLKQNENEDQDAEMSSIQSFAQNEAQAAKLLKNQKKVNKLARDMTRIEDNIDDLKYSQSKLLKKDMIQNKKSPPMKT